MSYLNAQTASFFNEASFAASRLGTQKRGISPVPPRPTPSPGPSSASLKRAHDETAYAPPTIPTTSLAGKNIMTQVTAAISWLRDKAHTVGPRYFPFKDIANYLSLQMQDETLRLTLEHILKSHSRVDYLAVDPKSKSTSNISSNSSTPKPKPESDAETKNETAETPDASPTHLFRYKPQHNVRTAEELLTLLQSQTTATGIPVASLRDGWPGCLPAIASLSNQGLILCTRNKKDQLPKRVWANDASLIHTIDAEFAGVWERLKVPLGKEELRKQVLEFGLNPTSTVKVGVVKGEGKEKKKKGRRGGKVTNSHMSGVLRDFGHLRK